MTRVHIYFESIHRPTDASVADAPVAAPSQVRRDAAAGNEFQAKEPKANAGLGVTISGFPAVGSSRRGAPRSASDGGERPATQFSFGDGPATISPGRYGQGRTRNRVTCAAVAKSKLDRLCRASARLDADALGAPLERGEVVQTLVDILAVLVAILFLLVGGASILVSIFILLFVHF